MKSLEETVQVSRDIKEKATPSSGLAKVLLFTGLTTLFGVLYGASTAKAEQRCVDGGKHMQPQGNFVLDCQGTGVKVFKGETPRQALEGYAQTVYGHETEWLELAEKYFIQRYGRGDSASLDMQVNNGYTIRVCIDLPSTATVECTPISPNLPPSDQLDPKNQDNDKDGYTPAGGDCNDNDPAVNPGVEEICGDSVDNNCNGEADEGCRPACTPGAEYRGSEDYNALKKELLDSYVPRNQENPKEKIHATSEKEVIEMLTRHSAKRENGKWVNGGELNVTEGPYTVPQNDTLNPFDTTKHKVLYVTVGGDCYKDAGHLVARIKIDDEGNVLDVNWGKKGDYEWKNWIHSGFMNPWVTTYASAEAGDPAPFLEGIGESAIYIGAGVCAGTLFSGSSLPSSGSNGHSNNNGPGNDDPTDE